MENYCPKCDAVYLHQMHVFAHTVECCYMLPPEGLHIRSLQENS